MKIIYDNLIFSWQRFGGISVVWSNLLQRMLQRQANIGILEYESAEEHNISRKSLSIPSNIITTLDKRFLKLKRYLNPSPSLIKEQEKFIFHSSYYRTMNHPDAVNITTVHDFSYELFESNKLARFIHCWQKHRAIRHSDHIVCISENTRKDLFRILPDISANKVSVIYNGIDSRFHQIPNHTASQNFVLYVGKRDRYKNFNALINPLAQLGLYLKIVGPQLTTEEIKTMKTAGLKYDYCGVVSDEQLNQLYNDAFCLLYTSLYEGFGLPILEAQQAGCPVIAYNASSIPEVIGDKRLLLNSITKEELEEKIAILNSPLHRKKIIEKGIQNAARFSWDKMVDEYEKLYNLMLKE